VNKAESCTDAGAFAWDYNDFRTGIAMKLRLHSGCSYCTGVARLVNGWHERCGPGSSASAD